MLLVKKYRKQIYIIYHSNYLVVKTSNKTVISLSKYHIEEIFMAFMKIASYVIQQCVQIVELFDENVIQRKMCKVNNVI